LPHDIGFENYFIVGFSHSSILLNFFPFFQKKTDFWVSLLQLTAVGGWVERCETQQRGFWMTCCWVGKLDKTDSMASIEHISDAMK